MTTVSVNPRGDHAVARAGVGMAIVVAVVLLGALLAASPFVVLGLAIAAVFVVAVLVDTQVATLAAVFLIYLDVPGVAVQVHGLPSALGGAFVLLLLIPFLVDIRRGEPIRLTPTLGIMVVLFLFTTISTLMSAYPELAISGLEKQVIEGLLLYFLLTNVVRTRDVLRRALWMIIVATSILAVLTIFQGLTGAYFRPFFGFAQPDPATFAGQGLDWRASGPFGDPNYYGQILVVGIAIALVFCWRERTAALRLAAGGAALLMLYAVALTSSRGAGVAFLLLLVAMAFMRYFRGWQMLAMVLGVAVLLVAVPSYVSRVATVTSVGSASSQVGSDPNADLSAQQRSTEMVAAYHVFLDHYVVGVGPSVFPAYYRRYAQATGGALHDRERSGAAKGQEAQREAHNILLDVASSLGLLGLLAFLGVVGTSFAAAWRVRRACLVAGDGEGADLATALVLAFAAYLLAGMFLSLAYERYFWMLAALLGAAWFVLRPPDAVPTVTARRVVVEPRHTGRR